MKIFLSYSDARAETGKQLRAALANNGVETTDASTLASSTREWSSEVTRELRDTDATVFVVDPGAEHDPLVQREWRLALEMSWSGAEKPMIPIVLGDGPLPAFLRERQAIRIPTDGDVTAAADAIVAALQSGGAPSNSMPAAGQDANARQQRLDQIRTAATMLEPSNDELARQARLLAERCSELERTQPYSVEHARARIACSDVLKAMGRKGPALHQLERAIAILERHPDEARRLARTRMNAANLMEEGGRESEARTQWEKSRDAYLMLDGPLSLNAMIVRRSLIQLLRRIGDNAAADAEQAALDAGVDAVTTKTLDVVRSAIRYGLDWLTGKRQAAAQKPKGPPS